MMRMRTQVHPQEVVDVDVAVEVPEVDAVVHHHQAAEAA
jgi:hypothetical protein